MTAPARAAKGFEDFWNGSWEPMNPPEKIVLGRTQTGVYYVAPAGGPKREFLIRTALPLENSTYLKRGGYYEKSVGCPLCTDDGSYHFQRSASVKHRLDCLAALHRMMVGKQFERRRDHRQFNHPVPFFSNR